MRRASFDDMPCSVARSLEVIGEWWTPLILRDCFLGVTRFDDFQRRLGIARNVLTDRLDKLVAHDIVKRVPYQEHPPRSDYKLTAKGRDLWLVVAALREWGDRWDAPDGAPIEMVHTACGAITHVVPTCSGCGELLTPFELRPQPGPGASAGTMLRVRETDPS